MNTEVLSAPPWGCDESSQGTWWCCTNVYMLTFSFFQLSNSKEAVMLSHEAGISIDYFWFSILFSCLSTAQLLVGWLWAGKHGCCSCRDSFLVQVSFFPLLFICLFCLIFAKCFRIWPSSYQGQNWIGWPQRTLLLLNWLYSVFVFANDERQLKEHFCSCCGSECPNHGERDREIYNVLRPLN